MNVNLLDLYGGGHHRSYVEMLCDFWVRRVPDGVLRVFISSAFVETFDDLFDRFGERIDFHTLAAAGVPSHGTHSRRAQVQLNRAYLRALKEISGAYDGPIVLLHLDHALLAAARFSGHPESVSGIYIRAPFREQGDGLASRAKLRLKRRLLGRAVQNRAIQRVFCLDPTVVGEVDGLAHRPVATALPDGIQLTSPSLSRVEQRSVLGATERTRVLLLFGVVSRRKGIVELCDALRSMSPQHRDQCLLVVAGQWLDSDRSLISAALGELQGSVRVVEIDSFVPDQDMASLFEATDVVLVPYTADHLGSSGILVRAAATGTPVIGPANGLVSEYITTHRLGQTTDPRDRAGFARTLETAIDDPRTAFDLGSALAFGEANSSDRFAETIYSGIGCPIGQGDA